MKKVLLLYYSGSGSTKTLAEILFEQLTSHCNLSAIEITRYFDYSLLDGYDVYFFAFPTYQCNPPDTVLNFIKNIPVYLQPRKAFALNTFSLYHENCLRTFILKLQEKNILINDYISIKGPASDAILFYPDEWLRTARYEIQILMKIEWAIKRFNKVLNSETNKVKIPHKRWYTVINRIVLKLFAGKFNKAKKDMTILEYRCTNCNYCIDICPSGCFTKGHLKPELNTTDCEMCLSCVHNCPVRAIIISKDMKDKFRFNKAFYAREKQSILERLRELE